MLHVFITKTSQNTEWPTGFQHK